MDENLALGLFFLLPGLLGWALVWLWRRAPTLGAARQWPLLLTGNALFFFLLISLVFLFGEIYVRFFYDTTDSLGYTKVCERWVQRYWQVNSAMCRDNLQYYPAIKAGKRRVTFVGDSFTAGHGVKNVEDRFANRLRREHPDWEVHAIAQPGHETGDEIKLLEACLQNRYALDTVVLVYCLNDVSDLVPEWNAARDRIYSDVDRTGWLKNSSYFVNLLYHRRQAMRNPWMKNYFDFVRDTASGPVWEQQKERLDSFKKLVEANQGRLLVVTFPFLHAVGKNYQFQPPHDALDRFWRDRHVPHLDLLPVFQDLPAQKLTVNRFDAHPNEYAHALAAEAIGRFLREQISLPP